MSTRSDYAYYTNMWQKSWFLEIVDKSGIVQKSFAFSMPPQSARIRISQRINEKKTFGGIFTDDYGIDTAQISLSGTTGNTQLKEIILDGANSYVTGAQEASVILNNLAQYKRNWTNYADYTLYLYDLSQSTIEGTKSMDSGWEVNLKDISLNRDSGKPLFWNYDIEFTGIRPLGIKKVVPVYTSPAIDIITALKAKIAASLSSLTSALSSYEDLVDKIAYAEDILDTLASGITTYANTLKGFITTTEEGINSVFQIVEFPMDLTIDLVAAVDDIRSGFESTWTTIESNLTDIETKSETVSELWTDLFDLEDNADSLKTEAEGYGSTPQCETVPSDISGSVAATETSSDTSTSGTTSSDYSILTTYGYKSETATSETTLDKLAVKYYGDADYASTIAIYNGIKGDSDITVGMELKIPYLSYTSAIQNNETYSSDDSDFYGTDIKLSDDGDIELAEYGDYKTIDSVENIGQAMNLRLAEDKTSRVRLDNYGITSSSGTVDSASLMVFISSVKETLAQDPRIHEAGNFEAEIDGDAIRLTYDCDLENGGTYSFSSSV